VQWCGLIVQPCTNYDNQCNQSEIASMCENIDVYIANFGSNNAKGKIKNAVLNKFKVLCKVKQ